MGPAVHTPSPTLYFGIKYHPVGRIHPFLRHTSRGTGPGLPPVFASEKSNVRRGDKLPVVVKRIKVITVGVRYIQSRGNPPAFTGFSGVNREPACASVRRAHGPSQIRPVA